MADPRIFLKEDGIIKMELQDDDDDDDDDEDYDEMSLGDEEPKNSHTGDDVNRVLQRHDTEVGINIDSRSEERATVAKSSKVATGLQQGGVGSVLSLSLTKKKKQDPRAIKSATSMRRQLPLSKKRRLEFSPQTKLSSEGFKDAKDSTEKHDPMVLVQATVLSNEEENDSQDDGEIVEAIPMSDDSDENDNDENDDVDEQSLKVTQSSKPRKFRPSMSTPLVATPSIASDKRVLLHTGPAESLPSGWTEKLYKRTTGLKHTDRYWYSPLLKKKFRSLAQVSRFLDLLKKESGDEEKAWELFRMNPPRPDEIRSKQQRSPGSDGGNKKEPFKTKTDIKNVNYVSPKKGRGGNRKKDWTVPPIASPGLYMIPPLSVVQLYQNQKSQAMHTDKGQDQNDEEEAPVVELNDKGYITPSLLFDHALYEGGHTKTKLSQAKYYGSSIPWTVDDIFSRDFSLMDKDVMAQDIWNLDTNLVESLSNNFFQLQRDNATQDSHKTKSSSSNHILQFDDMSPKSLTISLPKSYIDAKKEYIRKVKEREQILIEYHKQKDANEDAMDEYEVLLYKWQIRKKLYEKNNHQSQRIKSEPLTTKESGAPSDHAQLMKKEDVSDKSTTMEDLSASDGNKTNHEIAKEKDGNNDNGSFDDDNNAPYGPKPVAPIPTPLIDLPPIPTPPSLPEYLKKEQQLSSMEINPLLAMPQSKRSRLAHLDPESFLIGGRYYGLLTNNIADPQFVGPNAPGISGLSHINNKVQIQSATTSSALVSSSKPKNVNEHVTTAIKSQVSLATPKSEHVPIKKSQSKVKSNSYAHLKQIIGKGGEEAESMRMSIIKAGVFASRNAIDGGTFIGANGETFQGLSKAFSNYSNCKPCARCKGNKQGAYHCRLKRKHDDLDYDGGNSYSILAPLFESPLEDLCQEHNHVL